MVGGYIYILGSHTGTLYIGVTSNLSLRPAPACRESRRDGATWSPARECRVGLGLYIESLRDDTMLRAGDSVFPREIEPTSIKPT